MSKKDSGLRPGEAWRANGAEQPATPLQEAEKALAEQIRFLQVLMDTIPSQVFYKGIDGRYQGCNKAFEDFTGISKEEMLGKTVHETAPKELADKYDQMDRELLQNPGTQTYEFMSPTPDGTPNYVIFKKATFTDADGRVAGLIGVITDITEMKKAEEKIAHLASFPQLNPNPVIEINLPGAITFRNDAALQTAEKLGLKDLKALLPADLDEMFNLANQREKRQFDREVKIKEAIFQVYIYFTPQFQTARLFYIDITARQQVEKALLESEKRFRDVTENAQEWVWEVDAEGKYTYASPIVEKLLGYQPEEVLGKHYYALFHPEDREKLKEMSLATFAAKQPFREFINRNLHKDGRIVWLSTSGVPILDQAGNLLGYRGADIDITKRQKAEEALRESESRLRRLYDTVQAGIILQKADGTILHANQVACDIFGMELGEITGKTSDDKVWQMVLEDGTPVPGEEHPSMITIRTGKPIRNAVRGLFANDLNRMRWFLINTEPILDPKTGNLSEVTITFQDITKQKQAQAALEASLSLQKASLESTADGILVVDPKGRMVSWNRKFVDMWRLPEDICSSQDDDQALAYVLDQLKDPQGFLTKVKDVYAHPEVEDYDFILFKDGRVFERYSIPQYLDKRIVGRVWSFRDVTARVRAEEALRESEEKYRLLVNQIPAVVFRGYGDWSVDCFDEKVVALTGYRKEDFNSRKVKWSDLIPAEDFDYAQRVFLEALKTNKSYVREHRLRRKNGEIIWVQCRGQIFCDESGKVDYVSGVSFDITGRKRAELALQESEQKLANIIDFLPDATLVIDREGQVIAWNKAIEDMTGIKAEDMLGKGNYEYALPFYGKRRPILIDLVLKPQEELAKYTGLQKEGVSLSGVAHFPSFRGKEAYLFGKASILLDSHGNIMGAIESIRDITDRQKAEAERLRFNKLESLGLLAGGIAHDFNNILTAIIGNISLAMLNQKMEDPSRERLSEAERACQQAQTLARQLLTFAKGGAPVKKITSMAKTIDESVMLACRGSKARCECQASEDLWPVEADPGQIGQVFQNLIINATQAMPTGGTIEIRAENLRLKATGDVPLSPGKYVKVTIQDQGIGIPAEYLPKIFDPYFTTKQTGSGLGLATAYSIIKNHHGDISVESTMGVGTTFHLYLPASDQKIVPRPEQDGKLLAGKGKILVMDDEEIVRNVLAKMLANLGYEAALAQDGAEAIEKFTKGQKTGDKFAAVILDLTVPGGIGGKETMTKLREIDPQVKAIVSSGYSDDPIMAEFKKYGFSAVIAKPYKVLDLGKTLHDVIIKER